MLENKKTHNGIHYSRYIASWYGVGGKYYGDKFAEWLKTTQELTDDEIREIRELATCGKLELEYSAGQFLKTFKIAD